MMRPEQHPAATTDARKRLTDASAYAWPTIFATGAPADARDEGQGPTGIAGAPVSDATWAEVIREHRATALREAADAFEHDYAATWGGPAAWLTTGDAVGRLVAEILRELAEEVE